MPDSPNCTRNGLLTVSPSFKLMKWILAPAGDGVCAATGVKPAAAKTASSVSVVLNHVVIINSSNKINRTARSYTRERKRRNKFLLICFFQETSIRGASSCSFGFAA